MLREWKYHWIETKVPFLVYGFVIKEILSLRADKSIDSISSFFVPPQGFRINTIGYIVNTAISLSNSNDGSSGFCKELGCPIPHISKTLHDNFFPSNSRLNAQFCRHGSILENLFSWVKDSKSRRLRSTSDPHLINMFAGSNSSSVNISMSIQSLICVFNQAHLCFSCANVGAWDIDMSTYWAFFGQCDCIVTSQLFELALWEQFWIHTDTTFCTTVRETYNCAFYCH